MSEGPSFPPFPPVFPPPISIDIPILTPRPPPPSGTFGNIWARDTQAILQAAITEQGLQQLPPGVNIVGLLPRDIQLEIVAASERGAVHPIGSSIGAFIENGGRTFDAEVWGNARVNAERPQRFNVNDTLVSATRTAANAINVLVQRFFAPPPPGRRGVPVEPRGGPGLTQEVFETALAERERLRAEAQETQRLEDLRTSGQVTPLPRVPVLRALPGTVGAPPPTVPPPSGGQRTVDLVRSLTNILQLLCRFGVIPRELCQFDFAGGARGPDLTVEQTFQFPPFPQPPAEPGEDHVPTIMSPFFDEQAGGATGGSLFNALRGLTSQFLGPGEQPTAIGTAASQLVACGAPTTPFRAAAASGFRAQNYIVCNPGTGAAVWFGKKGRPMLWSDDLAACKRVKRVASKASSAAGVRRRSTRRGRR